MNHFIMLLNDDLDECDYEVRYFRAVLEEPTYLSLLVITEINY
ncbi:MAG TPA: hypothetical protein PLD35_04175 [Caldisericia bacterium]|nr:hypothetical protein [Caldisericia bacterium]HPO29193.1 hypothetical protein [Caldisericia bacterium]HXK70812.1 hypothetical protein [Caldisericia bacterium]